MKRFGARLARIILLVTVPFLGLTLIEVLMEITGGKIGAYLQTNYKISTKTFVLSLSALLFLSIIYQVFEKWNEERTGKTIGSSKNEISLFFDSLKKRYSKRYESKLDGRFEITLEVSENWHSSKPKTYKFDAEAKVSNAIDAIRRAFDEHGRLLIVGNPGSGKTVLLLRLAISLFRKDIEENQSAVPVIFNLASWSEKYLNFQDWLIEVLVSAYDLSRNNAKELLRQNQIVFLLDGLDELARLEGSEQASYMRSKCLNALNDYLREGRKAVICCRQQEFVNMQNTTDQDAPVLTRVEVLDLTKADIILALQEAQQDDKSKIAATNLINLIETNETFLEVLSTPFYFTTALEVFDMALLKKREFSDHKKEIEKYLLDKFVETKLDNQVTLNPDNFNARNSKRWLRWLAKYMENRQLVTFELAAVHPFVVPSIDILVNSVFGALSGVIPITAVFFLLFQLDGNVFVLNFLLYFLYIVWERIFPVRLINFLRVKRLLNSNHIQNWYIVILWLSYSMFCVLWAGVIYISVKRKVGLEEYSLAAGKMFFFFVLIYVIPFSFRRYGGFTHISNNYQRLKGGILFSIFHKLFFFAVIVFLLSHYTDSWVSEYSLYSKIQMIVALTVVVGILNTSLTYHFMVRILFGLVGSMPFKYATFLDYAAEARILEKDGGHWRFRHQNLQEYFAKID